MDTRQLKELVRSLGVDSADPFRYFTTVRLGDQDGPVAILWGLSWKRRWGAEEQELWDRAFKDQSPDGAIRPGGLNEALETWVYEELVAIHYAFKVAWRLKDESKLEQVRRAVKYHVENTQPDTGTTEPWGVAAFLALDETGTFAEQQMHDARTQLGRMGPESAGRRVIATVLVDALATLEYDSVFKEPNEER